MKKTFFLVIITFFCGADLSLADWDRNFIAVNYKGFPSSIAEIDADLAVLGPRFGYIRTYNSLFGAGSPENAVAARVDIYNAAHPATPIKAALGVALTPGNPAASQAELDQAITNAKAHPSAVNAVVVGNENLGNISEADLINYLNYAKTQLSGTGVSVTTCQTWGVVYGHPNLVSACSSYILANIYPYFDGPGYSGGDPAKAGADTLKNWQSRFLADYNQLVTKYGAAKIHIGETGWPSGGAQATIDGHFTGIPSQTAALPNEQTFVEQYAAWAASKGIFTYLFSSFDEAWKTGEPGNVGPYFGVYTSDRVAKWLFGQLPSVAAGTTLWLGNDSPYGSLTFSGGTLQIIDSQTTWPNAFTTTAGTGSTLDTAGNSLTLTGTLSGSGNLTQTGGGLMSLQGDGSGFSGTYTVDNGRLNLANVIGAAGTPCTVAINQGGTLSGLGPLVGTLMNRGTVSPGNSPGTLSVVGSYTQTASGTLRAEIASPTNYDRISVTGVPGTASLNGRLTPVLLDGYRPTAKSIFPGMVTATGGLSGAFSAVDQPAAPTLLWQPYYTATSFGLGVVRDYNNQWLPLSRNQKAAGAMLNSVSGAASGDLDNVLNAIDSLPSGGEVANAFKQISPDKAASLATLSFAGSTLQSRTLANRITNLRYGSMSGTGGAGGLRDLNLNYSRDSGLMLAYNSSSLAGLISGKKEAASEARWGIYLDPGVVLGSQKSSVEQTGFGFTVAGFTAGIDYRVRDDLLAGLASGYSHAGARFRGSDGGVEANSWPLTAYAAYQPEPFYAYGSLGYTLNLFNLERSLAFDGINRTARSTPTGNQFNAFGEAGYDLAVKPLVVTPMASLAYSSLWVDGFIEGSAGALNLKVAPQQADSLQTGVGAKVAIPLQRGPVKVVPQFYATYQHEFSNGPRSLDARLSQGSSAFVFQTDRPQRDFAVVGANVTLYKKNFSIQLNYNTEIGRSNYTVHYLNAGLRWEF